jgi:hypothetical protein
MIFAYLWLVFFLFLVHEWVVLESHDIDFRFFGLAAVNALVLSKIMLIAEELKFADRFKDKPLIYPIAFKAIAFSMLLVGAYIYFRGRSVAESFPQIGGGGLIGPVTIGAILCVALVPFFAFREIARALGEAEFRTLMLGATKERHQAAVPARSRPNSPTRCRPPRRVGARRAHPRRQILVVGARCDHDGISGPRGLRGAPQGLEGGAGRSAIVSIAAGRGIDVEDHRRVVARRLG